MDIFIKELAAPHGFVLGPNIKSVTKPPSKSSETINKLVTLG